MRFSATRSGLVDRASVLLVDGDETQRGSMVEALRGLGCEVRPVGTRDQAIDILSRSPFDLVITDIQNAGPEGPCILRHAKSTDPDSEVLVTIVPGATDRASRLVEAGAFGYLTKPFLSEELALLARRALERTFLARKIRSLEEEALGRDPLDQIVAVSRSMSDVLHLVRQVARLDATVLISGEAGTGKRLISRALHRLSPRKEKPIAVISCGVIPKNLQEGEIFGRAGGTQDKAGLVEEADGGTLILEDVDKLSIGAQVSLLRLLQAGEVSRVGSGTTRALNVRVIAATEQDLEKSVEERGFLEDLYYRVSLVPIRIPALRERPEDIPSLVRHLLRSVATRKGIDSPPSIPPRVMDHLTTHTWPRNVSELEATLERAVAIDSDGVLGFDDLPHGEPAGTADRVLERARKRSLTLSELEREYILDVLSECGGARRKTAERLGITTATLWRKLKRYETER